MGTAEGTDEGAGRGSGAAGRITGFWSSTGPCADDVVLLASGVGRLQLFSDCARTGAMENAASSAVPASACEMILVLPLMIA